MTQLSLKDEMTHKEAAHEHTGQDVKQHSSRDAGVFPFVQRKKLPVKRKVKS